MSAAANAALSVASDVPEPRRSRSPKPPFSRMTSAIAIPPSRTTASTIYGAASLQSTPEGMVPISHSSLPMPSTLNLPESLFQPPPPPTSSPSAMAEALAKGSGGLIRRVSRGARQGVSNKFRRNGTSTHRERSSGPVIMRRRSDSRTAADGVADISDLELGVDMEGDEEVVDDCGDPFNALGIAAVPRVAGVAPVRNIRLEQGTRFQKITKRKTKPITLRLDLNHAKVYWDPSRPSKAFYIDDVREIRSGRDARHYREECKQSGFWEPYWFTIVYSDTVRSKGRTKTMHLIADSVATIELWKGVLDKVSRERIDVMAGLLGSAERSAKKVWRMEMQKRFNGSERRVEEETMDLQGIIRLCRSLHINCSNETFRFYFNEADAGRSGKLTQAQFLHFVRRLKERKDIKSIYDTLVSPEAPEIDQSTFLSFLASDQGVDVMADPEYWVTIFEKFARSGKPKPAAAEPGQVLPPPTMNFVGFQSFLNSSANSCYVPSNPQVRHDRPLNEYFISSSHNTYLTGRQVIGESSTEAYITALQKGCRCIEIDCWNGNDKQPIVNHGRTLTTSISFRDTIKVINQYAFCESPYPLILSLEVHCDREQQARMAEIMKQEFGEKLLLQPLDWESSTLPSPEELKGRILIKVKAAAEDLDGRALAVELTGRTRKRSISSPIISSHSQMLPTPPSLSPPERPTAFWVPPRASTTPSMTVPSPASGSSAEDSDSPPSTDVDKKKKKSNTSKIIPVLGDLGVYTKGIKFTNFRGAEASMYNHVFSIGERTFRKLTENGSAHPLEEHNMRCLMRVYPSFHRIASTNFEPLSCWRRGVQMAALNWQTYDLGQQLNEAMFAGGNDRSGYVLKPVELRPESPTSVMGHRRPPRKFVKFSVEIISAQQLPRPQGLSTDADINPYIEFEMHCAEDAGTHASGEGGQDASARNGLSGIGEPIRKRTRIVKGNGYNPEFRDKITMTLATTYPDLVFVRWTVWNSRDAQNTERTPLATFTAKLSSLQQGYRHLPLFDGNGEQYLFSTLFCKIEKEENIEFSDYAYVEQASMASFDSMHSTQDNFNGPTGRSFLRKLIHRTPSGSRRRQKEPKFDRSYSDPRESEADHMDHSSVSMLERYGTAY